MRVSNCTEFEQRLREAIESRASVDEATFCAHAADCDDCRRQWEEYLLLSVAVAEWNSGQPEIDLADAILAQHAFRENEEYAIQPTSQDVETANIATSTRQYSYKRRKRLPTKFIHRGNATVRWPLSPPQHSCCVRSPLCLTRQLFKNSWQAKCRRRVTPCQIGI